MRLIFSKIHKSITELSGDTNTLPDFVVLTGLNGTGKSHLLQAIENGSVLIEEITANSKALQNQSRPIRLFDWLTLVPSDSGVFTPSQIAQERYNLWNDIFQRIQSYQGRVLSIVAQHYRMDLANKNIDLIAKMTVEDLMQSGSTQNQAQGIIESIQNLDIELIQSSLWEHPTLEHSAY